MGFDSAADDESEAEVAGYAQRFLDLGQPVGVDDRGNVAAQHRKEGLVAWVVVAVRAAGRRVLPGRVQRLADHR